MSPDISHAVRGLLEARRTGIQMAPPFALPNRDAVYAIQDGVVRATGPAAGWKVGARTPTAEPNPPPLLRGALVAARAVRPRVGGWARARRQPSPIPRRCSVVRW